MATMMKMLHALVVLVLLQRSASNKPTTTCDTPESVAVGESTSLTCLFTHDLDRNKTDFYVYRANNDSSEPVIVTICKWDDSSLSCETDESYTVRTADISNQVRIEIPSATQNLSGTYFCKTLSADETSTYTGCSLTVTSEPSITCETSGTVSEGESAHLTCDYHLDLNRNKQDFYIYRFHNNQKEPAIITLCTWDGDAVSCETDKDYVMTRAITGSQVTLDIKSASQVHSGKYMCKTLSSDILPHTSDCSLTVQSNVAEEVGTGLERPVTPAWYILLGCGVGVLLVLALVFLIYTRVPAIRRCVCSHQSKPRYSKLRDTPKVYSRPVFMVQGKAPYYKINTESRIV